MKNLVNHRFGKLTATNEIKREGVISRRLCYCDCGNTTWIPTSKLTSGHTKSCGCYQSDFKKINAGQAVINSLFGDYRRGAKKRNFDFSLSYKDFIDFLGGNCFYCGSPPYTLKIARRKNGNVFYNGIDRVDNFLGYKKENCVSCCKICNRAKGNLPVKEFNEWIKKIKNSPLV